MRTRIFTLFAFFAFLLPTAALAHAGHGTFDGISFWHYLTSPLHLISAMVVLGVAVIGVWCLIKRRRQIS